MLVYLTADEVGIPTGGGVVTKNELEAFQTLGNVALIRPLGRISNPFDQDEYVLNELKRLGTRLDDGSKLAHVYAGCFTQSLKFLKRLGYKVSYTIAAHDVDRSRAAHLELGLDFPYPHLTDPQLFTRYIAGYRDHADVVIVPGKAPEQVVRKQGRQGPIEIIPHGCGWPDEYTLPNTSPFVVGYMGAIGADKGLLTLARAWKEHVSRPGRGEDRLLLCGGRSTNALPLFYMTPGSVQAMGWANSKEQFFDEISLYVQPSATEGFGIPALEAMSYARPVICSDQAGAADLVPAGWTFEAGNVKELARRIEVARHVVSHQRMTYPEWFHSWRMRAERYKWEYVKLAYVAVWKKLLEGQ